MKMKSKMPLISYLADVVAHPLDNTRLYSRRTCLVTGVVKYRPYGHTDPKSWSLTM